MNAPATPTSLVPREARELPGPGTGPPMHASAPSSPSLQHTSQHGDVHTSSIDLLHGRGVRPFRTPFAVGFKEVLWVGGGPMGGGLRTPRPGSAPAKLMPRSSSAPHLVGPPPQAQRGAVRGASAAAVRPSTASAERVQHQQHQHHEHRAPGSMVPGANKAAAAVAQATATAARAEVLARFGQPTKGRSYGQYVELPSAASEDGPVLGFSWQQPRAS